MTRGRYCQPFPAVDGNVLRAISRIHGISRDITLPIKSDVEGIVSFTIPELDYGNHYLLIKVIDVAGNITYGYKREIYIHGDDLDD